MVALFCKDKKPTILLITITNLVGWYQGVIHTIGMGLLGLFTLITYLHFALENPSKLVKTLLFILEALCIVALAFHYVPMICQIFAMFWQSFQ